MEIASRMREDSSQAQEEVLLLQQAFYDPNSFAPLYERYFLRIYRYCLRRTGHPQDSEDLTSQIFTRALNGLSSYRGGTVAAWIFRIAHNTTLNHLQKKSRRSISLNEEVEPFDWSSEEILDQIINVEDLQKLGSLVAALPEEQQELLALYFEGSLSSREIGAVLGKSEVNVRVTLHRVIQRLRSNYWQELGEK